MDNKAETSITLVIVGGVQTAIPLSKLAKALKYRVIIIEPRSAFADKSRFSDADQIFQEWPDEAMGQFRVDEFTAVAILTHDPKIDDPGIIAALVSAAFYVGALGSMKTQAKRKERLLAAGLSPHHIIKLMGPIGLDIGAQTSEEIALSIMAEIVDASKK